MSDCVPFRLYVGEQLPLLVPILQAAMKSRGTSVSGDDNSGRFSIALPIGGSISGSFRVDGKSLAVEIQSRPAAISCGLIESKMQDFILDAKAILRNQSRH